MNATSLRSFLLLGALSALPFLMGADGGCGGSLEPTVTEDAGATSPDGGTKPPSPSSDGGTREDTAGKVCRPSDCGSAASLIAPTCPGTNVVPGLTCKAQADGKCGWVPETCPKVEPNSCAPDACGPTTLEMKICPGTDFHPSKNCKPLPTGGCGWQWQDCPPPVLDAGVDAPKQCSPDLCGPTTDEQKICPGVDFLPTKLCRPQATGKCGWEWEKCPVAPDAGSDSGGCVVSGCSGQLCGTEPMASTCEWREEYACYQKFGVCARDAAGTCGWRKTPELASCLQSSVDAGAPKICGGLLGRGCATGEYCNYPLDARCGAADQTGVCSPRPQGCTKQYDPVCGCDDRTYGNACEAASAGVSVSHVGACESAAKICGGFAGVACSKSEYCAFSADAICGYADATGVCKPRPEVCDTSIRLVCGCDGKTYNNACEAMRSGVSVLSTGACK